jgi:multiple sugar transport system permease protein
MSKTFRNNLFLWLAIIVVLIWSLFPIFITIFTSLKMRDIAFKIPPLWIFRPVFSNYKSVLTQTAFGKYFVNSMIVTSSTTIISITLGCIAAYSFARFKFFGKNFLLLAFLCTRMFPPIILAIPMFLLGRYLNLVDTRTLLICAHTALNLPFVIWMMHEFFRMIPKELDEAAMVDGCTRVQGFFRVILPLTGPGLVATAIFCVLLSWNDFLFALMLTGARAKTLSVAITMFTTIEGVEWGNICAAASITMIPVLVFSIVIRNYLVRGMTLGAVKN